LLDVDWLSFLLIGLHPLNLGLKPGSKAKPQPFAERGVVGIDSQWPGEF
jgi:hypothetical protein